MCNDHKKSERAEQRTSGARIQAKRREWHEGLQQQVLLKRPGERGWGAGVSALPRFIAQVLTRDGEYGVDSGLETQTRQENTFFFHAALIRAP